MLSCFCAVLLILFGRNQTKVGLKDANKQPRTQPSTNRRNQTKVGLKEILDVMVLMASETKKSDQGGIESVVTGAFAFAFCF